MALVYPGTTFTARHVKLNWVAPGGSSVFALDYVAESDLGAVRFACGDSLWLDISDDGGVTWQSLPGDAKTGIDIGAVTAGDVVNLQFRASVPPSALRSEFITIFIGEEAA